MVISIDMEHYDHKELNRLVHKHYPMLRDHSEKYARRTFRDNPLHSRTIRKHHRLVLELAYRWSACDYWIEGTASAKETHDKIVKDISSGYLRSSFIRNYIKSLASMRKRMEDFYSK